MKLKFILLTFMLLFISTWPTVAQEAEHCVVRVYPLEQNRNGELLGCFATANEALAFASNNRILIPVDATPEQISSAVRAFQAKEASADIRNESTTMSDHVVSIQWDWTDRGGNSVYFTSGSLCSETANGHLLSTNYSVSHPSWNNAVASAEAFAGCSSVQLWDLANFQGSNITCSTYCSNMGAMNDNTTSSRTWK